jgi:serine/threonine protein kinase
LIKPSQVAPALDDDSSESELEDVRSPRSTFVRQKSQRATAMPPIALDGAPLPPPPPEITTIDVSDIAIVHPDGRGAFGALRLGAERSTRQLVSVKDCDGGDVNALRKAARAAGHCAQLVACLGFGAAPSGSVRLVTEYLDGGSLRNIAVKKDGLAGDETVLLHVATETLKGLEFLHARQLSHGAVAPASIRIARDGRIKLADAGFGLDGPAQYVAPELKGKATKTPEGDVWALGQALFAAASGRFCARQLGGEPKLDKPYSPDAATLILHASRRDPELRATAAFLLEAPCIIRREWPFSPLLIAAVNIALGPPAETDDALLELVARAVASKKEGKAFLDQVFDK